MNVSRDDLYRLIVEEYAKEEGYDIEEGQSAEDLLKQILGDKYRPPEERDPARYAKHDGETAAMDKPHETSPDETFPIPADDTPESEYQGTQNDSGPDLADAIGEIVHGKDPEEIAEIFDVVYKSLTHPAVVPIVQLVQGQDPDEIGKTFDAIFKQLSGPEAPENEPPGTLYVKGAEGRAEAGFRIENLMDLIREVLSETKWYDLSDTENLPPAHSSDVELPASNPISNEEKLSQVYKLLKSAHELVGSAIEDNPQLQSALDSITIALDAINGGGSSESGHFFERRSNGNLKENV